MSVVYHCPKHIAALFCDENTVTAGRTAAVNWARSLDLKPGDKVWLPEIGWTEKTDDEIFVH